VKKIIKIASKFNDDDYHFKTRQKEEYIRKLTVIWEQKSRFSKSGMKEASASKNI
jgi:hypothetical protein